VRSVSTKMEGLLEKKLDLLMQIEEALLEEGQHLTDEAVEELSTKVARVDQLIAEIKNIDYDIAFIEASESTEAGKMNKRTGELTAKIQASARKNEASLGEIIGRLGEARNKVKSELEDIVPKSQISGSKPHSGNKPFYIDSRN